jgi:hypothetical protein
MAEITGKIESAESEIPSVRSIEVAELLGDEFPVSPSGTHVMYPSRPFVRTNSEFHIIRSVVMDADGNLNIDSFVNEVFCGYYSDAIEYVGLPSTVVLNNSNVVMASQIFDRPFEKDLKDGVYDSVRTIQEYFSLRKEKAYRLTNKAPVVTWIGAPSVIFNYQNRIELSKILGTTGLNMIFWLTSFNSTTCIVNANVSQYKYCNRFQKLKTLCNDKRAYQIHATYSNFISENNKFITNFDDALNAIHEEQLAIEEYNREHNTDFYQRYNEMVTYFFPWDINGIEIGMTNPNNTRFLAQSIFLQKQIFSERYIELLRKSPEDLKNYFDILTKNYIRHPKKNKLVEFGYSIPDILFCKFLLFCKCGSNLRFSGEQLSGALNYIIEKLREPLQITEYIIGPITRIGAFILKGEYNGLNNDIFIRVSNFALFTQNKSEIIPNLTQVSPISVPFFSLDQGIGLKRHNNLLNFSKKNLKTRRRRRKNRRNSNSKRKMYK